MNKRKLLLIGLPSTGKSTFLAALWYVVSNSDTIPCGLKLKQMPANTEYLNLISGNWMKFRDVGRTSISGESIVSIEFDNRETQRSIEILFPDLSGERFRQQVEERHITADFNDDVINSLGALLFIHAGKIEPVKRLDEAFMLASSLEPNQSTPHLTEEGATAWNPSMMPTEVKLVELLQILMCVTNFPKQYKLGIILSAWDLVKDYEKSPLRFLKTHLPLVAQFLEANKEVIDAKVFGISAQGGSLNNDIERRQLADNSESAYSRIIVKCEEDECNDITVPIQWFLST